MITAVSSDFFFAIFISLVREGASHTSWLPPLVAAISLLQLVTQNQVLRNGYLFDKIQTMIRMHEIVFLLLSLIIVRIFLVCEILLGLHLMQLPNM